VEKVAELRSTIKFQMKKVLTLGIAVGHVEMSNEELITNIVQATNFLVSLLKKVCRRGGKFFFPFHAFYSKLICTSHFRSHCRPSHISLVYLNRTGKTSDL
jgi:hypothetical protein